MKRFGVVMVLLFLSVFAGAQWFVNEDTDLMTDVTKVSLYSMADVSQNIIGKALFAIRRSGENVEVFISWGGYSMDRVQSAVRFGSGDATLWSVTLSTDKEATFFILATDLLDQLQKLNPDDTITIAAKRATGVLSVARWNVGNVSELIDQHIYGLVSE